MLTANELRELLDYRPDSGKFYWRKTMSNRAVAGSQAGSLRKDGRYQIRVLGKIYLSHRLAWLHAHGAWPEDQIDHKNVEAADNRLSNLREATPSQNLANVKARCNNKLGVKGVRLHWTGRYEAYITVNRRQKYLGGFSNPKTAHAAYARAAKIYYGEFARTR